jgi:hypothetical protein
METNKQSVSLSVFETFKCLFLRRGLWGSMAQKRVRTPVLQELLAFMEALLKVQSA